MRKNLCHFLCVIVLLIVAFNHYQFAKKDKRNMLDFHEQLYSAPAIGYCYYLQGLISEEETPLYAKLLGCGLFVFGKSYFNLRMFYLLFLLIYLVAFYFSMKLITDSAFIALLAVVIQSTVPVMISYSRLCWPHMYGGAFVLVTIVFLFRVLRNKKGKYLNGLFFILSAYLSVKVFSTSIIYIGFVFIWLIFCNYKTLCVKKNLIGVFFVIVLLICVAGVFIRDEILVLAGKVFNASFFYFFDFLKYQWMFFNKTHYFIFATLVVVSVAFLFLRRNKPFRKNMILFLLFLLFTIMASYLTKPIDATILGLLGACALVAFFIGNIKNIFLKSILVSLFLSSFVGIHFFPEQIVAYVYKPDISLYRTAIVPDTRQWGREAFKKWLRGIDLKSKKISLFSQFFYPAVGVNYLHPVDISIMLEDKIPRQTMINYEDIYDGYNMNHVDSLAVEMISDTKINESKFIDKLRVDQTDYLIFEEIINPVYWLFAEKKQTQFFNTFKDREELVVQSLDKFDYKKMSNHILSKIKNDMGAYLYDVGVKYKYIKGYRHLNSFLKNCVFLKEVKRIKCSVKDIVIYRIEK